MRQFDNTNSGALFPIKGQPLMTGPFQFDEKEPKHVAVLELGKPGEEHTLRVHERKKDLSPGKLVAEGKVRATANGGAANRSGNPTPVARGTLTSKKHGEIRVCFWLQANNKQGGTFYQVKPDSFTPMDAPAL